ncbi:MAG TPA: hypothetical protein VIG87_05300 [Candidatus Udaeobacter sp.]
MSSPLSVCIVSSGCAGGDWGGMSCKPKLLDQMRDVIRRETKLSYGTNPTESRFVLAGKAI